jgi:SAM-dependent methyltransferase
MSGGLKGIIRRVVSRFPEPQFTRPRNLKLFDWTNQNGPGKRVLNLGSGIGQFDHYLSKEVRAINLDISTSQKNLQVIAVLKHVRRPWVVADEIFRVLRPGGHVVLELPFLNVIHDKDDYLRFTDKGIRSLFDSNRFDVVFEQVSSGGGSFLSIFLLEYFQQFIPSKVLKTLWRLTMRYFTCLFKYFDMAIDSSKIQRITANSFSFIGKKR